VEVEVTRLGGNNNNAKAETQQQDTSPPDDSGSNGGGGSVTWADQRDLLNQTLKRPCDLPEKLVSK
jgi:hypothetical protein